MVKNTLLSVVIPVFNEEESVVELITLLKKNLKALGSSYSYEIIFVNDGSFDGTLQSLINVKDKVVKIVSLRKNLGKATALNCGFAKAKGDLIITLDGDLQDGPENIKSLINKINEGYDLVVGWKKKRHDPIFTKNIPSLLFNGFVRYFSGIKLHDFNCGLKAIKKEVAKEISLYGELHRFIPVLAAFKGFKVAEVQVVHHVRKYGKSKYGFGRGLKGLLDFLTVMFLHKFSERPLHFFGIFGIVGIFIGTMFLIYLTVLHFQGVSIGRRPLLNVSVLLIIAGLQMFLSGLIAEMITNNASDNRNLPIDYERD